MRKQVDASWSHYLMLSHSKKNSTTYLIWFCINGTDQSFVLEIFTIQDHRFNKQAKFYLNDGPTKREKFIWLVACVLHFSAGCHSQECYGLLIKLIRTLNKKYRPHHHFTLQIKPSHAHVVSTCESQGYYINCLIFLIL